MGYTADRTQRSLRFGGDLVCEGGRESAERTGEEWEEQQVSGKGRTFPFTFLGDERILMMILLVLADYISKSHFPN